MQKLQTIAKILLLAVVVGYAVSEKALAQDLTGVATRPNVNILIPETTYRFNLGNPNLNPVITALAFTGGRTTFLTGGDDHKIYYGDVGENGVATLEQAQEFEPLDDWIRAIAINPMDGAEIAALSQSGQVVVWNVAANTKRVFDSKIKGAHSLDYSPNGKILAVCGFDAPVRFFDAKTHSDVTTWTAPGESSTTLKFSPDGRLLALGGRNGVVRVWETWKEEVHVFNDFSLVNAPDKDDFNPKNRRVRAVCFSPDGTLLAAAGDANQIAVWNLTTKKQTASLNVQGRKVYSLVFCDDSTLVAGDSVNDVIVWNIPEQNIIAIGEGRKQGSKINNMLGHTGTVSSLIYDLNTRMLFSGSFDTTVIKWQVP